MIFEINYLNLSFNIAQNIFVFYLVIFNSSLTAFNLKSNNDYLSKNYQGSVGEVTGIYVIGKVHSCAVGPNLLFDNEFF